MGKQAAASPTDHRTAIRWILRDLHALDVMLGQPSFDTTVTRIGAEQEMFLVDQAWRPAPDALAVLDAIDDAHFTTEIGAFNLEANLDPQPFTGACMAAMHTQLEQLLAKARAAAGSTGLHVVLAGILPTVRKGDLSLANMVQHPRYVALNTELLRLRGDAYELHIKGTDELRVRQDSVMAEACNASFQVHLQVRPDEFVNAYNVSQLLAGPVLSCATNSPILFGKRLWSETRIALFEQAVDTRRPGHHMRDRSPRVTFGTKWLQRSITRLFREDVTRFRPVLTPDHYDDPFVELEAGRVPTLDALSMHSGTVWRWNRGCYGITDGVPHLRIENRVLPSGPTPVDEIANAALWLGLMRAVSDRYPDVSTMLSFDTVRSNFVAAARQGLSAPQVWLDGEERPSRELVLDVLLPLAELGLAAAAVDEPDRTRYLGVIERRVRSGATGSRWIVGSLEIMRDNGSPGQRLNSLTAAMVNRQQVGTPVAEWMPATLDEGGRWRHHVVTVEQLMATDLVTVDQDDPVELAAHLMDWHHIRQVPVEDDAHRLVGLVSYRAVLRIAADATASLADARVSEVMKHDPVSVPPDTAPLRALELMHSSGIHALPVVVDDELVGIVTEQDFMNLAGALLLEQLTGPPPADPSPAA